jgi:hypothetical protein
MHHKEDDHRKSLMDIAGMEETRSSSTLFFTLAYIVFLTLNTSIAVGLLVIHFVITLKKILLEEIVTNV